MLGVTGRQLWTKTWLCLEQEVGWEMTSYKARPQILFSAVLLSLLLLPLELPSFLYEQANEVAVIGSLHWPFILPGMFFFPGVCLVCSQPSPKSWISATLTTLFKTAKPAISHTSHSYTALFSVPMAFNPYVLQKLTFRMSTFLSDQM